MKKILLILLLPLSTHSQWLPAHGPEGGNVKCLATDGTHMYAGTENSGVFLSIDSGNTWQGVNNGLPCLHVQSIAILDTIVFAGTTQGFYRSYDLGNSWTQLSVGGWIWSVVVNGGDVIAGMDLYGLQISHDAGNTWHGYVGGNVHAIAANGPIVYAGSYSQMAVSLDSGQTWNTVQNGLPWNIAVNSIAFFGTDVIASVGGQVYMTSDTGQHWILRSNGLPSQSVFQVAVKGNKLFASVFGNGIYYSVDSGATWIPLPLDPNNRYINGFLSTGNDLWVGCVPGVNKSTDDGFTWQLHNHHLSITDIRSIAWLGNRMFGASRYIGINVTDDNGNTWALKDSGITNTNGNLLTDGSNILYGTEGGIFLSTDSGESWTSANNGLILPDISCLIKMGNTIYVGTNGDGPYYSIDHGNNWNPVNVGLEGSYTLAMLAFGSELYVSSIDSGIFQSLNGGLSWTPVNNGLPSNYIISLATDGTNIYAAGGVGDLYISSNHGASWSSLNTGFMISNGNSITVIDSVVFFCTADNGFVYSTDQGANWQQFNNGLGSLNVTCIVKHGQDFFAGTPNLGLWIYSNISTGTNEKNDLSALSIYPNPAKDHFTLQLNKIASDKILIYDVAGRVVFEEKSDQQKFSATTEVYFNFPAGVYFVKCGESVRKLVVE